MKNVLRIIIILSLFLCGCKELLKEKQESVIPVEVLTIGLSPDAAHQVYLGEIVEDYASQIGFLVPGQVEQVYVNENDRVQKGEVLAEINKSNLQDTYEAAAAVLRQAEDGYGRMKILHQQGSLSDVQWVEMETNLEKARSAANVAKKNLEDAKLRAPFSGIIGKRMVDMGTGVMPGTTAFTLLNMDKVNVKVSIPENILPSIRVGQKAKISIPALGKDSYEGSIKTKGVVANKMSHMYDVLIPLANPKRNIIPGMICDVQLFYDDTTHYIIIPNQAVKYSYDGTHFVWVVKDNKAVKKIIKTGEINGNGIIVTEGLEMGEKVIVKGYQKISDATKVSIIE